MVAEIRSSVKSFEYVKGVSEKFSKFASLKICWYTQRVYLEILQFRRFWRIL